MKRKITTIDAKPITRLIGIKRVAIMAFFIAITHWGFAQVPETMHFQGTLLDPATRNAVPDGDYALTFSLYDAETVGTEAWTEKHDNVPVSDGNFSVLLGNTASLADIVFDKPYWVEITVNSQEPLPRLPLASSPYALRSRDGGGSSYTLIHENAAEGFVGIGTTSPNAQLHLEDVYDEGGKNLQVGDDTFFSDVDVSNMIGLYGIPDNTRAGLQLGATGPVIWGVDGNVGIGTTTPSAPLHVKADSSISPASNGVYVFNETDEIGNHAILSTRVAGANAGNPFISFDIDAVNGWSAGIDNSDEDKFKIANTWDSLSVNTRLTIATNGNMGIGTTTPQEKLHLYSTDTTTLRLHSNFYDGTTPIFGPSRIEFWSDPQEDDLAWRPGYIQSTDNGDYTGGLAFFTNGTAIENKTASMETMRLVNGNVGINKNNPQVPLDVNGIARFSSGQFPATAEQGAYIGWNALTETTGETDFINHRGLGTGGFAFYNIGEDETPQTPQMFIDGNGNVGIGTNTPTARLHIDGGIKLSDAFEPDPNFYVNDNYIAFGHTGTSEDFIGYRDNTFFFKDSQDGVDSSDPNVVVGGSVGIGITSPTANLDVSGVSDTPGQISLQLRSGNTNANFDSNQISFGYSGSDQYRHAIKTRHNDTQKTGNAIDFYVWEHGNNEAGDIGTLHTMTLDAGNVGIGTASPVGLLEVSGTENTLDGLGAAITIENTHTGGGKWYLRTGAQGTNTSEGGFSIADQNGYRLLINNNGNIGIDRVAAANKLEVGGNASKDVAGDWLANSDARIKQDITDISHSLETIKKLRPVKFRYTESWREQHPSIKAHYYYNFIAQEFKEVFPEAAQGSGEYLEGDPDEILQIDTYNAQIVAIRAIQELIDKVEALEKENSSLKLENNGLKEKVTDIEHTLAKVIDLLDIPTSENSTAHIGSR